jgi:hypothetical protein
MKKSMQAIVGAAAAASAVGALASPAGAVNDPAVFLAIQSGGHLVVSSISPTTIGSNIHVTTFGNATVAVIDASVPIRNWIGTNCQVGLASGDAARPNRAICQGIVDPRIEVHGTTLDDTLWVEVPGHWSEVSGHAGNDTLIGSRYARDVMSGGPNKDTITVSHSGDANADSANCGSVNGAADAAADTVNYNGSDTLSFCNALDTKNYSTK